MTLFNSRKRRWLAGLVVLLALFLLRPGASRLKSRIIYSISAGVGRPADVGSVRLRLLPRPGFDLANLVVYDDPAFGSEPILRAGEVTAYLRLTSLVRGRLEVARLELAEPSLNLAHDDSGRWNLGALVERAARTPLAPTGNRKSEPRPRFPYIEATSGRINFKIGAEKKPYALTNADFSLWQESDNTWGLRLKAQPFRSDFNLNDMGLLLVNGTWQRAESLRETPLQINVEWSRAQLGQLTKFVSGADKGWRGAILLDVALKGTPARLSVSGDATVEDFRRYDITSGKSVRLAAHCDAEYSSQSHEFHQVACNAPVGDGLVTLSGEIGLPRSHHYEVLLTADEVPASGLAILAQRAKKDLADDLVAAGTLHGRFSMTEDASSDLPLLKGNGEIADFRLSSAANKIDVGPLNVPFLLSSGTKAQRPAKRKAGNAEIAFPEGPHIEFGPVVVNTGRAANAVGRGWVNHEGYQFALNGETEIGKSLKLARLVGLPALSTTADGGAHVDLRVAGAWSGQKNGASGFPQPQVNGSAKIHRVQIAMRGVGAPIELLSGDLTLSPDGVRLTKLDAKAANAQWTGSVEVPRGCGTIDACQVHFSLNTSQASLADLNEWVHPHAKARPWYRVLEGEGSTTAPVFESLHASGRISAERLEIRNVAVTRASVNVLLEDGKAKFSDLNAELLGGTHRGQWSITFGGKTPVCEGSGNFAGISLAGLSDVIDQHWITGKADTSYKLKSACGTSFWASAEASFQFKMKDGVLPQVLVGNNLESLRFSRIDGMAELHAGKIEIKNTLLDSGEGQYQVSGTASLQREIDLKLTHAGNGAPAAGYTLTGTLAEPKVTPLAAEEQARLKTAPTK